MPSDSELWEAVFRDPNSLEARLRLADALAAQRDPRAEFIRVQCALENPDLSPAERTPLLEKEQRMIERYGATWRAPIVEVLARPSLLARVFSWFRTTVPRREQLRDSIGFRRGLVGAISLSAQNYRQHADEIFRIAPITDLTLVVDSSRGINPLAASPFLKQIESLFLILFCGDAVEALTMLFQEREFPSLRSLAIAYHGFDAHCVEALTGASFWRKLRFLAIRSWLKVGQDEWSVGSFTDDCAQLLMELNSFPVLRCLNLASTAITRRTLHALLESHKFPCLRTLILWNTQITQADVDDAMNRSPRPELVIRVS